MLLLMLLLPLSSSIYDGEFDHGGGGGGGGGSPVTAVVAAVAAVAAVEENYRQHWLATTASTVA